MGNGATTNGLPATVSVLVKEQTWTNWQELPLSRTNLYAGDVYLPLGFLSLKWTNAADAAAAALPAQSVHSSYYFYNNGQAGGWLEVGRTYRPGSGGCDWDLLTTRYPAHDLGETWKEGGVGDDGGFVQNYGSVSVRATYNDEIPPGFQCPGFKFIHWGSSTKGAAMVTPGVTGKMTQVTFFGKHVCGGGNAWTTYVDHCQSPTNIALGATWTNVWFTSMSTDWTWYTVPINRTNGCLRVRTNKAGVNCGVFIMANFVMD